MCRKDAVVYSLQGCFFSMCSAMQQNYCSKLQRLEMRALLKKKRLCLQA